ncbi:hypothetical protein K504DRAFT_457276 [Pleomassaria siparia CBS 279.74]|uniref:Apple domain-containing protein n=1 Tax=Pleomassaria siparia CBS 279.74 TaxID=1314801 RepID=A0A6G1KQJ5_9PLEO|nr:hypothetical protein K504DRAFT_457276 [Pleomassaria siparia CBS 279.74]
MQSFTAIIAALAISSVSASPINNLVARSTCGSAPGGSGSQSPLSQPTGIQNAQGCQDQCTANGQCQSFVFGLVDSAIKCMLFNVPAAQVPNQGSTNLIAFDKGCTGVPTVTPTSANPTGANQGTGNNGQQGTGNNGQQGTGNNGQQGGKQQKRDTCGVAPSGPTNQNTSPLSQPANIQSSADCKKQCQANSSCKSFTFGSNTCKLFNVAASAIPAGAGSQAYDVGCSI